MDYKFSNIADLKRLPDVEGETGIDLKISSDIFLICLAATEYNPRWTDKAEKAFAEINRLRNSGASDMKINTRLARLLSETIVIGWHGGIDDETGDRKPGGPAIDGTPIAWSVEACTAFLAQADDAMEAVLKIMRDHKLYRVKRVDQLSGAAKNG